jgi:serine/threonine-protein kinase RsbW
MPGTTTPIVCHFGDLSTVVDEIHALVEGWIEDGRFEAVLDAFGLYVMHLAVHEWIANLVQHADFGARPPAITLTVTAEAGALRCLIEDNSDGFDFQRQVERQQAVLEAGPEPSERGRGLLMLIACTDDLLYEPTEAGLQRLAFAIRPSRTPDADVVLFPGTHVGPPLAGGTAGAPAL